MRVCACACARVCICRQAVSPHMFHVSLSGLGFQASRDLSASEVRCGRQHLKQHPLGVQGGLTRSPRPPPLSTARLSSRQAGFSPMASDQNVQVVRQTLQHVKPNKKRHTAQNKVSHLPETRTHVVTDYFCFSTQKKTTFFFVVVAETCSLSRAARIERTTVQTLQLFILPLRAS